ncbi:MAG: cation diffusion facilitator family transporter [Marinilabiliales bacterium]|nr:cation diffusion facilitator family transporter [Marinilabiliales bacterium]
MQKEKRKVALMSVMAAVFLTGFKLIVGFLTGSLGILSEGLHSALDLFAASITYFSVRISDKPADRQHNFGHGKIENFSALLETILLFVTSIWIIYEAMRRLTTGEVIIKVNFWSFLVVISSIIIDITRSRALMRVAKKYNSQALEADAIHFATDIWSSSVVLLGLICSTVGFYVADPIAALGVAVIVLVISYRLGRKAIEVLLDTAPQETIRIVRETLGEFREIRHYHSLKVRTSGADTFIKVNVHLDPELNLKQVHEICDNIESELGNRIDRSEVYIHAEPQESGHISKENEDGL